MAVALGLFQDVRLTWTQDRALTLPALKWITMEKDDNGFPWIVLGVKGAGCYSLQVPDWSATRPAARLDRARDHRRQALTSAAEDRREPGDRRVAPRRLARPSTTR